MTAPAGARRLSAAVALVVSALAAPAALAAPDGCGPTLEPAQVETLTVELVSPPSALRLGRATPVEVAVRRDVTSHAPTSIEGAHVSLRVRTGRVTSYVDGTVDATGRAALSVTLDQRAPVGPATVVADVWAEPVPAQGCQQVVREHGADEMSARVSR